ncbi:hypothetical protein KKG52_02700 [Patescibacteria group bacterium]|nr:hypothetical protein [Patescibacteria group bacterium]
MKEFKKEEFKETWNKKKLFALFLAIIALSGLIYYFLLNSDVKKEVKGLSQETPSIKNTQKTLPVVFREQLDSIKQSAGSIDVVEIATSSAQVQKIINDIKALENYPGNQAKNFCQQICESF